MALSAKEIVAVVDREPAESQPVLHPDRLPLGDDPHEAIASALRKLLPLGGTAVLIDTDSDPDFLGLRTSTGISMIDPVLLKAQTEVDVRLVTHQQAVAAAVRAGTMHAFDIGPHTIDSTQPFGLVQIISEGAQARISVSVIDASGHPSEPTRDFSCTVLANVVRITDILGHNLGMLLTETHDGVQAAGVALYIDSETSGLGGSLRKALNLRFGGSLLYPLRIHIDPYGGLRGALALAQQLGASA